MGVLHPLKGKGSSCPRGGNQVPPFGLRLVAIARPPGKYIRYMDIGRVSYIEGVRTVHAFPPADVGVLTLMATTLVPKEPFMVSCTIL